MKLANPWNELVKIALLGTARAQLSTEAEETLRQLGWQAEEVSPATILEAGALWQTAQKAGRQLPAYHHPIPVDEDTDTEFGHPQLSALLHHILQEDYLPLLPEFSRLLIGAKRSIPPENLPEILNHCIQQPELFQNLKPLLGSRGEWLMLQNPDWLPLSDQVSIDFWDDGTTEQRLALFRSLRRVDPPTSRQLVLTTWQGESPRFKAEVLQRMKPQLGPEDRPIIDLALEDRQKEVRRLAAWLASFIPEHPLREAIGSFVLEQLRLDGEKLEVKLAAELPELLSKANAIPGTLLLGQGLKASRLAHAIQSLDPDFILDHWALEPKALLDVFKGQPEYADLLLSALKSGVIKYEQQELAALFLERLLQGQKIEGLNAYDLQCLVSLAGPTTIQGLLAKQAQGRRRLIKEAEPLYSLIMANAFPWPDNFALQTIDAFRDYLYDTDIVDWNVWHYHNLLEKASLCISPALYDDLKKDWPRERPVWGLWEKEIFAFLRRLQFREQMHRFINA